MLSMIPVVPVSTIENGIIAQEKVRMTSLTISAKRDLNNKESIDKTNDAEMNDYDNHSDLSSLASLEDEDSLLSEPMDIDTSKLSGVTIESNSILAGKIPALNIKSSEIESTRTCTTASGTEPSIEAEEKTKGKELQTVSNSDSYDDKRTGAANAPILSSARLGLQNLGNTCYLNSAIQMLFSLENGFVQDLFAHYETSHLKPIFSEVEKAQDDETVEKLELRDALVSIGKQILKQNGTLNCDQVINPSSVKSAIDKKAPQFIGFRQHDSHEFLSALLDILHEEVKVKSNDNLVELEDESPGEKNNKDLTVQGKKKLKKKKKKKGWRRLNPLFRGGKRVSSFSELDSEAISDLLHGKENNDDSTNSESDALSSSAHDDMESKPEVKSWATIVSSTGKKDTYNNAISQPIHCTLAGGRAAFPVSSTIMDCVVPSENSGTSATSNNLLLHKPEDRLNDGNVGGQETNKGMDMNKVGEESSKNKNKKSDNEHESENIEKLEEGKQLQTQTSAGECSLHSFVDSHFCTEIRVTLTCDSCCYSRSKTEMYRYLSIDVDNEEEEDSTDSSSPGTAASVEEGLRRFFAPEKRELKCEKCFNETATQTMKLIRLPNALLLHFKRFIVEFSPNYNITFRKNQSPVEYSNALNVSDYCAVDVALPRDTNTEHLKMKHRSKKDEELVISRLSFDTSPENDDDNSIATTSTGLNSFCDEKGKFSIKSVVHHIGSTASCGHYTADVLIRDERGEQKWQRCNDCKVTSYTNNDEVVTKKISKDSLHGHV